MNMLPPNRKQLALLNYTSMALHHTGSDALALRENWILSRVSKITNNNNSHKDYVRKLFTIVIVLSVLIAY